MHLEAAAAESQHFGHVRVLEVKRTVDFIILFVKGPAGDEDFDRHGSVIPFQSPEGLCSARAWCSPRALRASHR